MTISVIVCAYNEEQYLGSCLRSLRAQSRPPNEIIVIDNPSGSSASADSIPRSNSMAKTPTWATGCRVSDGSNCVTTAFSTPRRVATTRWGRRARLFPFNHFMRECYNTPQSVYNTAKRRGMDLVTITDHDQISGALDIAHRPDVLVGCEVTAEFTDVDLCVHLNVLDITPAQHDEIQRLRHDVRQLMPYLGQQGIYTSLNHVASGINGPLTAGHLAAILPWVDGLEVINGTRLPSQNRTAMCLAQAAGKHLLGGGDSHTGRRR